MRNHSFLVLPLLGTAVNAIVQDYYTTNAVCQQRHCINPVFPGLHKIEFLQTLRWQKHGLASINKFLGFCKKYIDYDVALPVIDYSRKWNYTAHTTEDIVQDQERDAAKLFFFHISAMGLDAWDYPNPEEDGNGANLPMTDCVRQVARMACFTYLPQANPSAQEGMETRYVKPCKSSCENYVKECKVECCDDSVQCVFTRSYSEAKAVTAATGSKVPAANGSTAATGQDFLSSMQISAGYEDENGPSEKCTGFAPSQSTLAVGAGVIACLATLHNLIR